VTQRGGTLVPARRSGTVVFPPAACIHVRDNCIGTEKTDISGELSDNAECNDAANLTVVSRIVYREGVAGWMGGEIRTKGRNSGRTSTLSVGGSTRFRKRNLVCN